MSQISHVLKMLNSIHKYFKHEVKFCDSANVGDVRIICVDGGFHYSKLLIALFWETTWSTLLYNLENSDCLLFPDFCVSDLVDQLDLFYKLPETKTLMLSSEEEEDREKTVTELKLNHPVSNIRTDDSQDIYVCEKEASEFKCKICFKVYESRKKVYYHYYNVHHKESSLRKYKCPDPDCSKQFSTQADVTKHKVVHVVDKEYKCSSPSCESVFKRKADLTFHYNHHHIGKKEKHLRRCHCGKEFYSQSNLRRHISKFH